MKVNVEFKSKDDKVESYALTKEERLALIKIGELERSRRGKTKMVKKVSKKLQKVKGREKKESTTTELKIHIPRFYSCYFIVHFLNFWNTLISLILLIKFQCLLVLLLLDLGIVTTLYLANRFFLRKLGLYLSFPTVFATYMYGWTKAIWENRWGSVGGISHSFLYLMHQSHAFYYFVLCFGYYCGIFSHHTALSLSVSSLVLYSFFNSFWIPFFLGMTMCSRNFQRYVENEIRSVHCMNPYCNCSVGLFYVHYPCFRRILVFAKLVKILRFFRIPIYPSLGKSKIHHVITSVLPFVTLFGLYFIFVLGDIVLGILYSL